MWRHQQAARDREGDDAHDDEEERGDPLGRQSRGDTGSVSPVDGLTLPHQTHSQGTWKTKQNKKNKTKIQIFIYLNYTCDIKHKGNKPMKTHTAAKLSLLLLQNLKMSWNRDSADSADSF